MRLPGVIKDVNGNISILGKTNIYYMLDGEYLPQDVAKQIPASRIKRVDVTTNPGAKSGSAEQIVINLVTDKKQNKPRDIILKSSYDSLKNFDSNANYKKVIGKDTISIYAFSSAYDKNSSATKLENYLPSGYSQSQNDTNYKFNFLALFLMNEHDFGEGKKLAIGIIPTTNNNNNSSVTRYISTNEDDFPNTVDNKYTYNSNSMAYNISYSNFSKNNMLQLSAQFNTYDNNTKSNDVVNINDNYQNIEKSKNNLLNVSISNENNFKNGDKAEYGLNINRRTEKYDYLLNDKIYDAYNYNTYENSLYFTYQHKLKGIGVKPGLRYETYNLNGIGDNSMLLASLHLGRRIGKNHNIKASIASKSESIKADYFNNAQIFSGYNTSYIGNSNLKIGKSNNYELSYEYMKDKYSISATYYYRDKNNSISNIIDYAGNNNYIYNAINIKSSDSSGLNFNYKQTINKNFEYAIDLNYSKSKQLWQYKNNEYTQRDSVFDWKFNGNYKIDKDNSILLMIQQNGKSKNLNTINDDKISSSVKYSHNFKDNLSLSLEAIDFLASDKSSTSIINDDYERHTLTIAKRKAIKLSVGKRF